jgi:hypothetical protein
MQFLTTLSLLSTLLCTGGVLANFHVDITVPSSGNGPSGAVACPSGNWNCGCIVGGNQTGAVSGLPGAGDFTIDPGFCSQESAILFYGSPVEGYNFYLYYLNGGGGYPLGDCFPNTESMTCPGSDGSPDVNVTQGWVCYGLC